MSDTLPTFSDAQEAASQAAQTARSRGRVLIPWLPDPPHCPACDALLYASATFDPREVYHVTTWECRECEAHWPREPEYGESLREGPTERGARTVGELIQK